MLENVLKIPIPMVSNSDAARTMHTILIWFFEKRIITSPFFVVVF